MRGKTVPEISVIVAVSMSKLGSQAKADGLRHAYFCSVLLLTDLEADIRPADLPYYESIQQNIDWRGKQAGISKAEGLEQCQWVRQRYPQIAQALDLGAVILELIERKRFYRLYGFETHDDWYRALDDEEYLEQMRDEVYKLGYYN